MFSYRKVLAYSFFICALVSVFDCKIDKPKSDQALALLAPFLGNSRAFIPPDQEAEPIPPIQLPAEIVSVSPANASTFLTNWNDLGTESFHPECYIGGDVIGDGTIRIQKILPTSNLVLEVQFSEDVNAGTLELSRKGGGIVPGTFTRPDLRTARFETQNSATIGETYPYSAVASGFLRNSDGTTIDPLTWKFRTNFTGTHGNKNSFSEVCGPDQCSINVSLKLWEDLQEYAESNSVPYFLSDLMYKDTGGNFYGYIYHDCQDAPVGAGFPAKAQKNEFWFLESKVTFPGIAAPAKSGTYVIDSIITAGGFLPPPAGATKHFFFPKP